jgi:hypothetical protein
MHFHRVLWSIVTGSDPLVWLAPQVQTAEEGVALWCNAT